MYTPYTPFFQAYELGCSPPGEGEKRTGTFFSNQAVVTVTHSLALTLTLNLTQP